jgi:hypothetical protein
MNRLIAAVVMLALFPRQDEEALARGQKYLDKVAAGWAGKLPQTRLNGLYYGRAWMGWMSMTVKAAPAASGGAYEVTLSSEIKIQGMTMTTEGKALLAKNLAPLSAESVETTPAGTEKRSLSVAAGKWKVREEKGAEVKEREGTVGAGMCFEGNLMPLFALPDGEGRLIAPDSTKGVSDYKKLPGTVERTFEGKKETCMVLEIGHPGSTPEKWFFAADGRVLECQPEAPIKMRPITEAQKGKNLNEPIETKPSERRVLDLFLAIKKNDAAAAGACFDFERLARESIPNFATLPPEEQKKAPETMKKAMLENLLAQTTRDTLPEGGLLEEALFGIMKTTEKDDVHRVHMENAGTWKVYLVKDGDRKGQWLIFGIVQE